MKPSTLALVMAHMHDALPFDMSILNQQPNKGRPEGFNRVSQKKRRMKARRSK